MKFIKKHKSAIITISTLALLLIPTIVLADTTSDIKFCEMAGVRRTFLILGMCLNIIKIVLPLVIIGTAMISVGKTVISGKSDDLKGSLTLIIKKVIAGLVIFLLPTIVDFAFDTLIGYDDSGFTACTTCFLDTDSCTIPDAEPDIYTD